MIKFITGNKNKFEEVREVLGISLEQVEMDLPEIQEINAEEIIKEKLLAAEKHLEGEYVVEDTSLYLDCLKGELPGPFIKWFEKVLGNDGLVSMTEKYGGKKARAVTLIGYINEKKEIKIFKGEMFGEIVRSKGDQDFGWGPIFKPEGHEKTFGEMTRSEKAEISMRAVATRKLKEHLS